MQKLSTSSIRQAIQFKIAKLYRKTNFVTQLVCVSVILQYNQKNENYSIASFSSQKLHFLTSRQLRPPYHPSSSGSGGRRAQFCNSVCICFTHPTSSHDELQLQYLRVRLFQNQNQTSLLPRASHLLSSINSNGRKTQFRNPVSISFTRATSSQE